MSNSEKLTEIQNTEVATGRTYEALVEAFEHELGYLDLCVPKTRFCNIGGVHGEFVNPSKNGAARAVL